jgi:hypothetical protein
MAKYKVKTIAVAVKNNRVANHGELVDDSELTANPSEMIEAGSIELVQSDDVESKEVANLETETETETEKVEGKVEEAPKEVSKKDQVTAKLAEKK